MLCPNCQHWNEDGANFCEECGFDLRGVERKSKPVSLKSASKPLGNATAADNSIPAPPPMDLEPAGDIPQTMPYLGAKLVLKATGSIFKLGERTVIGREDPRLEIDFEGYPEGKYVSHHHAQITRTNGQYYIEDLGSSNHTYVNNVQLRNGQLEPLKSGDVVRFGKIEVTFHEQ
jgi:hypothetical protein